jgi:aryl-alcohol dehydrogenase-like predicted oxidoreductase
MEKINLGLSDIVVSKYCLGTMNFGHQLSDKISHSILDYAFNRGINFIDTAEMYPVPQSKDKFGISEEIIGNWFKNNPGIRNKIVCATKISGNSRGLSWIRNGNDLRPQDFEHSLNESLRRLQTDYVDLYQIHWPIRNVPIFGEIYLQPNLDKLNQISIFAQLEALEKLVSAGKIRYIGLSNETPYGVHEFTRLADQYKLPRIISVQNPYCLLNRSVENALDESLYRLNVSLLAYSPLAFGLLTGKYDFSGFTGDLAPKSSRMTKYESFQQQRWGRDSTLAIARLYNQLARDNGLTPAQLALAFCANKWQVTSTIIGITSCAQLEENIGAASIKLGDSLMSSIDSIRLQHRDPAQ